MKNSGPLLLYRGFARLAGPALARWLLQRRAARGKEVVERLGERFGQSSRPRPAGKVAWLHAASVGEATSLLPLIEALRAQCPDVGVVLTTGTRTSAELMAKRLPAGATHQFAPVDTPQAVGAFIDHWRPSLYAVVESEIWPVALGVAKARGLKTALLSARMSAKSARGWSYAPRSIEALLSSFDAILAQNEGIADRIKSLGAPPARVMTAGSLKEAAPPLPCDQAELDYWRMQLSGRPIWLAASTHEGEEACIFAAHLEIAAARRDAFLVIAPRHPERAETVAEVASAAGLRLVRRSEERPPTHAENVLMVDRLGEMGLWYRLAQATFIGGSLVPVGGHNPLEPARLGAPMAYGPHTENCREECERLEAAGGAARLAPTTAAVVAEMLALIGPDGWPTEAAKARSEAALSVADQGRGALQRHLDVVVSLIGAGSEDRPLEGSGDHAAA
ncbi:MAG: 3-deoxy-D-manno-octulosonic acid transferase [Neomegalonema sp.]|nr:3-deoxy-D-manno-octulosonic acid transferase [Neomegalonema sp.]